MCWMTRRKFVWNPLLLSEFDGLKVLLLCVIWMKKKMDTLLNVTASRLLMFCGAIYQLPHALAF